MNMVELQDIIGAHQTEYAQGMRSRLSSVDAVDNPHDADSDAGKAWAAGYDAAEGAAARNKTSGPVDLQDNDAGKADDAKAQGQPETAATDKQA